MTVNNKVALSAGSFCQLWLLSGLVKSGGKNGSTESSNQEEVIHLGSRMMSAVGWKAGDESILSTVLSWSCALLTEVDSTEQSISNSSRAETCLLFIQDLGWEISTNHFVRKKVVVEVKSVQGPGISKTTLCIAVRLATGMLSVAFFLFFPLFQSPQPISFGECTLMYIHWDFG